MLVQIAHAARTSMLVRIAHVARSAAAATNRFALLAERAALSPEAVAAASHAPDRAGAVDLLLKRSAAAPPPDALAAPSPAVDASSIFPPHYLKELLKRKNGVEFVVQEEDVKSDEALWALYERWCKAFNQKRDHDEMLSRFSEFKDTVLRKYHTKNGNLPCKLSKLADGKVMKMRANKDRYDTMRAKKVGNLSDFSSVFWKDGDSFLREVFADFRVVDGKLFVFTPVGEKMELTTNYEVVAGRLFADLPEGNELTKLNDKFMARRPRF